MRSGEGKGGEINGGFVKTSSSVRHLKLQNSNIIHGGAHYEAILAPGLCFVFSSSGIFFLFFFCFVFCGSGGRYLRSILYLYYYYCCASDIFPLHTSVLNTRVILLLLLAAYPGIYTEDSSSGRRKLNIDFCRAAPYRRRLRDLLAAPTLAQSKEE